MLKLKSSSTRLECFDLDINLDLVSIYLQGVSKVRWQVVTMHFFNIYGTAKTSG